MHAVAICIRRVCSVGSPDSSCEEPASLFTAIPNNNALNYPIKMLISIGLSRPWGGQPPSLAPTFFPNWMVLPQACTTVCHRHHHRSNLQKDQARWEIFLTTSIKKSRTWPIGGKRREVQIRPSMWGVWEEGLTTVTSAGQVWQDQSLHSPPEGRESPHDSHISSPTRHCICFSAAWVELTRD